MSYHDAERLTGQEGAEDGVCAVLEELFKPFVEDPSMMAIKAAALRYLTSEDPHDAGR
jgi:hypothetical protein